MDRDPVAIVDRPKVSFYDPLPKLKLKTFSAQVKTKSVKVKAHEVIVRADRNLFARLLIVAQTRSLNMRDVLCCELGPLPWSLASVDGSLAKTAKSKLLDLLEKDIPPAENVPGNAAWMIDAMALLQSLCTIPATFADLAMKAFDVATAAFLSGSVRIDFVVDRYPTHNIKRCERSQRAKQGIVKINIANRLQKCPSQWKKYLSLDSNKTNLSEFLLQEWIRPEDAERLHHRLFYVTHDAKCTVLTSSDGVAVTAQCVADLECCHEEAATRLLLHAAHAAAMGFASVVIRSLDTDVTILACSLCPGIPARIFFRTGTKTCSRFIDIQAVRNSVSENVCDALLGLHALTGCDTTSAFKRRG